MKNCKGEGIQEGKGGKKGRLKRYRKNNPGWTRGEAKAVKWRKLIKKGFGMTLKPR